MLTDFFSGLQAGKSAHGRRNLRGERREPV